MSDKQIKYITRPATALDYQYCYKLTKENMFELFSRHWGGWVASSFRNDFNVDETTIILCNTWRIGYYSIKENDEEIYLGNLQFYLLLSKVKVLVQKY